jgi:hypothetical protein
MKVTALINDDLVNNVVHLSNSKNITEGLVIALEDYVYRKRIEQFIQEVDSEPITFQEGFTAESVRQLNRNNRV